MNPQYMPQNFGAPPQQNFQPVIPNNMPQMISPNQMPPANQMPPQSGSFGPPRLNGPNTMGPPSGQFPGQVRTPSQQSQGSGPRPMYAPTPMGAPPSRPMGIGPGQPQICPPGPPNNQMGPPPSQLPPTSMGQVGAPNSQMGPPTSMGQPPSAMGLPTSMGQLPSSMGPPNQIGQPPSTMGPPTNQLPPKIQPHLPPTSNMGQINPPTSQMGPAMNNMGPPSLMGPPPTSNIGPPSHMGPPPTSNMGPPGPMGPPPTSNMGPPGPMAPPPMNMGPPLDNDKQNGMGPPQMGQLDQNDMNQNQPPKMPPTSLPGPPMGNQIMGALPTINAQNQNFGPPKLPTSTEPRMQPRMGVPPGMMNQNMGQMPPMSQPGMPPMPPMNNMNQMGQQFPPNNQMGPNQLANQMSGMQIGAPRPQYPGAPMKPPINGNDMNSPHMPPPVLQSGYMNVQQEMRSPQMPPGGYPPMPGQMPGGPYPPQPQAYNQQPQQARRLDPDQMPSPIQVTQDDQRTRSGIFCTNQKGLVPPLVSTQFTVQDQGNASPRFIRSTMYSVPCTNEMLKGTGVPFGLVISPMARIGEGEYPPPIVDFGELGPIRCIRCKAYMSPYMQFIDSGRRFQCLFCKATTEVPSEYFQHLDHTGLRVDRFERPELILGTYEFVATTDYCRNTKFPKTPALIFIIDISYNNIKSGLVNLLCSEMKNILKNLPIDQGHEKSNMKVGFITYNNTVHFYNIKGILGQPQMMVVSDTQDMFMPLLDGFLCDVEESYAVIDSLMEQIPSMFADTRDTEVVLMPAIQAGLEALKASECAGKLLIFHSTLPTAAAPGALKNRDDRKLLGTEKERTILTPQNQAYNQLGMDCVAAGCCVDMFIFNNSYIDIATIGQVCRLTGGEIFKYTYFQADIDGHRLIQDIITDISRPIAFDSIMRVRTSTGVRATDFFGHFYMANTTDLELAGMDCNKAVAVEIKHDDKLGEEEGVYIQVALLYTSCNGQRRLRIMNTSLKTCSQMADLYRSCELDTVINFFAKQSVYRLLENNPKQVKDALVNRCAQILACYRKNCASPSSAGQLILPECMKLLPLYVNCLLKSDALSGGSDMTCDDRSFVMQQVMIMDIPSTVVYFYPRLIPLHEIQVGGDTPQIPQPIRTTIEKMTDNGVYLLQNGIHMLMWIGSMVNPEWVQQVFGVNTAAQVDAERFDLPQLDNKLSIAVRDLIENIRVERHRCMRLILVKQRDKLELVFRHYLVEDRGGNDGSTSYVDFLCHMHKEIRQLLS